MAELEGEKSAAKSQTIQGNVLSILSTIGTIVLLVAQNIPTEILVPATTAAGGSLLGNILSILGRIKATKQIK